MWLAGAGANGEARGIAAGGGQKEIERRREMTDGDEGEKKMMGEQIQMKKI
jgi:hypothetical protein